MRERIGPSEMPNNQVSMGRYRALMTETDREHVTGESNPSGRQRDQAVYRVRQRIREELPRDIEVLAEERPDVLEELREVVCEGAESITVGRVTLTEGDRYEVVGPVPVEGAEHGRQFTIQDIVTPIGDEAAGLFIKFEDEEEFQYAPIGQVADPIDDGRLEPVEDQDAE